MIKSLRFFLLDKGRKIKPLKQAFYYFWKKFVFQFLNFFSDILGRILWKNRYAFLKNHLPFVILLINIMYGNSCPDFPFFFNCLVDKFAIHAFSTKFWQQCRVDINNSIRKGINQIIRDLQ